METHIYRDTYLQRRILHTVNRYKNPQKLKLALITEGHAQTDRESLNVYHGQKRFSI